MMQQNLNRALHHTTKTWLALSLEILVTTACFILFNSIGLPKDVNVILTLVISVVSISVGIRITYKSNRLAPKTRKQGTSTGANVASNIHVNDSSAYTGNVPISATSIGEPDGSEASSDVDQTSTWPTELINRPHFHRTGRPKIIFSCSYKDYQWLDMLKKHLVKHLESRPIFDIWDDRKILPGTNWKQAIDDAVNSADIVIVLVSLDFLSSDFIIEHELPQILRRSSERHLTVLPVLLSSGPFSESSLAQYKMLNPNNPLEKLSSMEREQTFIDMTRQVQEVLR